MDNKEIIKQHIEDLHKNISVLIENINGDTAQWVSETLEDEGHPDHELASDIAMLRNTLYTYATEFFDELDLDSLEDGEYNPECDCEECQRIRAERENGDDDNDEEGDWDEDDDIVEEVIDDEDEEY